MTKLLLTVATLALLASPATAQAPADSVTVAPLFSLKRVSLATGLDHRWEPGGGRQYLLGAFGAYNVTPHLSLTGAARYGFESEKVEPWVGVRIRIWQGR